jgi:hypothetical protein
VKLYEGEAIFVTLPETGNALPRKERINPIFFRTAPDAWLNTRPEPADDFVHFHSCYDAGGPVRAGYWMRHVALEGFQYDMGGRVDSASPLFHRVQPGPDRDFARIVEFDRGPL